MARFGHNYRSGRGFVNCPLCLNHNDSQEKSFLCESIRNKIDIKQNYNDIFNPIGADLPQLTKFITKIDQLRKEMLEET